MEVFVLEIGYTLSLFTLIEGLLTRCFSLSLQVLRSRYLLLPAKEHFPVLPANLNIYRSLHIIVINAIGALTPNKIGHNLVKFSFHFTYMLLIIVTFIFLLLVLFRLPVFLLLLKLLLLLLNVLFIVLIGEVLGVESTRWVLILTQFLIYDLLLFRGMSVVCRLMMLELIKLLLLIEIVLHPLHI